MTTTQSSAKRTTATNKTFKGLTTDEQAAMKERIKEMKAEARRGSAADGESMVLAKIGEMVEADRAIAERLHAVIMASAPTLEPRLWYGMPAYYKGSAMICFFQPAAKFKTRYVTLGFGDKAKLDEGNMWPSAYALTKLAAADEARVGALVKQAAS
jgi:uncharacterized protein YdhG (YjbR/CyaY superfamily)